MKICVISTTVLTCPPTGYAGLEMVAYQCAEGLARRGHEVTLVAPIGSTPPPGVTLHGTTLGEAEKQAYSGYWERLPGFDVVIDHSWQKWSYILKIEGRLKAPILGVLHAPANTMYQSPPPVLLPCLVAISQDQADHVSELWGVPARVCHNGVDLDFYKPSPLHLVLATMPPTVVTARGERYLFLARMSRIKGPHLAVDLARRLRFGLDLVGDDRITGEPDLAQRMRALATNNITYHGGVSRDRAVEFFRNARALLHMNQAFSEPFGLAPVEAQACGLPVIAFDNGAMRETIRHGETGFLVRSVAEVEALIKADATASISSDACRANAERFAVRLMIDRYEALCREAIEAGW